MDLDASHFPSGQHDDCGFFPEDRVSKRAVRLRSVTIQVYAVIYLHAISFLSLHCRIPSARSLGFAALCCSFAPELAAEAHIYI